MFFAISLTVLFKGFIVFLSFLKLVASFMHVVIGSPIFIRFDFRGKNERKRFVWCALQLDRVCSPFLAAEKDTHAVHLKSSKCFDLFSPRHLLKLLSSTGSLLSKVCQETSNAFLLSAKTSKNFCRQVSLFQTTLPFSFYTLFCAATCAKLQLKTPAI